MVQWDLPPCYFFPKAIVGPTPAITSPLHANCPWWHSKTHFCPISSLLHNFLPSSTKLLHYMQIRLWWHSETHSLQTSSLLHNFFPSGTVGPASSLVPAKLLPYMQIRPWWHSGTHSYQTPTLLHNFFPSGTVGPASSLVPP